LVLVEVSIANAARLDFIPKIFFSPMEIPEGTVVLLGRRKSFGFFTDKDYRFKIQVLEDFRGKLVN